MISCGYVRCLLRLFLHSLSDAYKNKNLLAETRRFVDHKLTKSKSKFPQMALLSHSWVTDHLLENLRRLCNAD